MTESGSTPAITEACAQCGKALSSEDRVAAGDKVFCRACYASLRAELEHAVTSMSTDIPWANAVAGAVAGGAAGALAWWAFTALTHLALGLFAVAIGFLTGIGTVKFSGGKRSSGLQTLSVGVAVVSFFVATYLVNMTMVNRQIAAAGETWRISFPPKNLELLTKVVTADFGLMDFVFLAIVIYEAWKIPRPVALPPAAST